MESSSEKSVRLPTFDGSHAKFQIWWTRFKAYAMVYKFVEALKESAETDLPGTEDTRIDEATDIGKRQVAAKKRNAIGMAHLTMALTSEGTMGLVYKAMTTDWPNGKVHLVVAGLFKKFQPQDTITRVELRQMLNKVCMKKDEDPAKLFEQLGSIENRYNTATRQIDQEDLIAVVFDAASKEYQAVLTSEQRAKGTLLTLSDLETVMNQHWRQIKGPDTSQDSNEISLANFDGQCYKCGEKGHKADKCTKKQWKKNKQVRFKGNCNNCGRFGHKAIDCWEKEENANKRPANYKKKGSETGAAAADGNRIEFLLGNVDSGLTFPKIQKFLRDPNVWIADSAATVHSTPHDQGFRNLKKVSEDDAITVANGKTEGASKVGDLPGMICDQYGNAKGESVLTEVTHLPQGVFNLFSLTRMQMRGWTLTGNDKKITLKKDGAEVNFDIVIPTPKGAIFALYFKRHEGEINGVSTTLSSKTRMTIQQAHERLGHCHEDMVRKIAKTLDWEIVRGTLQPCAACAAAKAKQKNVIKESEHQPTTKPGERMFLDLASVKPRKDGPTTKKPNWRILVDEATQLKFSDFYDTKSGMVEPTCEKLHKWREAGKPVKYLRLDNAGENKKLQERSDSSDWKLNIEFEYTARDTPQQNHLAELGFAIIANRGRALMHKANIPELVRYKVWREAFQTATLLDGLTIVELNGINDTRFKHWGKENPKFVHHLRTWGEAGTVKLKTQGTPKVADRGVQCMFVGYALHHTGDTYRMWDPRTNRVHITRDVIWLKRMFFEKQEDDSDMAIPPFDVDSNENERAGESNNEHEESQTEQNEAEEEPIKTRTGRVVMKPTRLIEEISAIAEDNYSFQMAPTEEFYYNLSMEEKKENELSCVGAGLGGGFLNTEELHVMKYDQAMQTQDIKEWEQAVDKEHERMKGHEVWKAVPNNQVPKGAKILTTTWAMKKKANGTYRARLNARGFEQIDGVHYDSTTKAAPVVNVITIRLVLVLIIMAGWHAELVDVCGAFLHGEFGEEEKIYMEVPQGFEKHYQEGTVLLLLKTIYGLKQAAYAFWKQLLMAFHSMNYKRSKIDPCLYFQWTEEGPILWISWVDDCLCCGNKNAVMAAKREMLKRFDCDEVGELKEYIGCKIEHNKEKRFMKLTQPVLLQSFEDEFNLPDGRTPNTPAEPGSVLKSGKEEDCISSREQKIYRTGVGKLLYLAGHSRPEIANTVRELTCFVTGALPAHFKAMLRCMQYCVDKRERGLMLKPNAQWNGDSNFEFIINGESDSDFAKDETRRSVSGWATFLNGAPISTKSKMQRIVALSVTEAELIAAVSCVQDLLFEMRILESIGLKVKKPMILKVDNKGVFDLINSWSVGGRTRHIDARLNFLRELKEHGLLQVKWIPNDQNSSDLFTKNLQGPLFEKHVAIYCGEETTDSQGESVGG
jgi:hypothetical protein